MKTFLHKFLTESIQPDEIDDFIGKCPGYGLYD